jgi:hypothetical protein
MMPASLLALCLLLLSPPPASAGFWDIFPSSELKNSATEAKIELQESGDKVSLRAILPNGGHREIEGLGEHFQFLQNNGKSEKIAAIDFDGDGQPEFVVRVTALSQASHVYVFHYDSELKKFRTMLFADDDHLVVDYNEPVEVHPDGISFEMDMGQSEGGAASRTRVLWKFREKRFLPF